MGFFRPQSGSSMVSKSFYLPFAQNTAQIKHTFFFDNDAKESMHVTHHFMRRCMRLRSVTIRVKPSNSFINRIFIHIRNDFYFNWIFVSHFRMYAAHWLTRRVFWLTRNDIVMRWKAMYRVIRRHRFRWQHKSNLIDFYILITHEPIFCTYGNHLCACSIFNNACLIDETLGSNQMREYLRLNVVIRVNDEPGKCLVLVLLIECGKRCGCPAICNRKFCETEAAWLKYPTPNWCEWNPAFMN